MTKSQRTLRVVSGRMTATKIGCYGTANSVTVLRKNGGDPLRRAGQRNRNKLLAIAKGGRKATTV